MKNIYLIAIAAVMIMGLSGPAMACTGCGCSLNTDDTVQGTASGWHVDERFDYINQSTLQLGGQNPAPSQSPVGMEVQKSTLTVFYTTTFDYAAEKPWGINIAIPFQYRMHTTYNDQSDYTPSKSRWDELSDIRVVGRYTGILQDRSLGVSLGMKLPTGSTRQVFYSGDNNTNQAGQQVDRGLQPGTGTWDVLLGGFKNGSFNKRFHWFTTAIWQKPLAQNNGFAEGQKVTETLGVRYDYNKLFTPQLQINVQSRWRDEGVNADIPNSGGQLVNLSPGLFVNLIEDTNLYVFVQIPVSTPYLPLLLLAVLALMFAVGSLITYRGCSRPTAGSTRPSRAHTNPASPPGAGRHHASRSGSTWWR